MGCWVPPAHLLETDSDDEEEEPERSGDESGSDESGSDEESSETLSGEDAPDVRMPNFAKIADRLESSARRATGPRAARAEKKPPATDAPSAGAAKRPPRAGVKKGKKTGAKPAKRVKA
jgi:hypothetical protein